MLKYGIEIKKNKNKEENKYSKIPFFKIFFY
jgi:hypothetical protein